MNTKAPIQKLEKQKYLIKIDRDSIKENNQTKPNYYVPGQLNKEIINGKTVFYREVTQMHTISTGPKYLYKYEELYVQCCFCTEGFLYTALLDEDIEDYDGDIHYKVNICPACGNEDCCELEFERIEDIIQ